MADLQIESALSRCFQSVYHARYAEKFLFHRPMLSFIFFFSEYIVRHIITYVSLGPMMYMILR